MMAERDFSNITIVSVTGLQAVAPGAMQAIALSAQGLPGARQLLVSPELPPGMLPGIAHFAVQPFGYMEYSVFVLFALHHLIETDYALIVQDDGWVVDPGRWRDDFLHYDYIGAPNHFARVTMGGKTAIYRNFTWTDFLGQPGSRIEVVQNGGFSLRSRRLLEAPAALGMTFGINAIDGLAGVPARMCWSDDSALEDVWLCHVVRAELERQGFKFAPLEVARHFAIEHAGPRLHSSPLDFSTFGQHSTLRKLSSTRPRTVEYRCEREHVSEIYGEAEMVGHIQRSGFEIVWPEHSRGAA